MGRFLKYTGCSAIALIAILVGLDWLFTSVYLTTENRSLFERLKHHAPQEYDFVVIGSSRVVGNIQPKRILDDTGKNGVLLTRLGAGTDELLLITKLFFANGNRASRVFYQIDDSWDQQEPNVLPLAAAMPFIRQDIYREHYENWSSYGENYYFPFYRYARFAPQIGLRELTMSVVKDKHSAGEQLGFTPFAGEFSGSGIHQVTLSSETNLKLEQAIEICQDHGSAVYCFTAPYHRHEGTDFDSYLSDKLPDYRDFSELFAGQSELFKDASHLNPEGAEQFTDVFIETYFKSNP